MHPERGGSPLPAGSTLRTAVARYTAFFRQRDVVRLYVTAAFARMPLGTVTLAMLLHVRELTGSFAAAGTAVGAYLAASALTSPVIGRLIDRHGPHGALVAMGIGSPLALAALWLASWLHLSTAGILAIAAAAGALSPPITVLTRTMWRHRFADASTLRTAFALDSVLVELSFTAGPALIALLLVVGSPFVAFGAALAFATLAVPIFMWSPALRYWPAATDSERHLLGPLTDGRLLVVYATTFFLTCCFGLLEIGYPGFASAVGYPPAAGLLIAVNSAGSALGGLIYGGMPAATGPERQLRRVVATMVLPLLLHAFLATPGMLAVAAFVTGLCIAPALTIVTMLVSSTAPARYATEAFTWSATCVVSGVGAGNVAGGLLLERYNPGAVFIASAALALLAACCAAALRPSPPGAPSVRGT